MCKMSPEAKERAMSNRRPPFEIVVLALVLAAACGGTAPAPTSAPLSILVTNDDGIEAPGIAALAEALHPLGTGTVYSATVGAAREAAFLGIPAIAVNLAGRKGAGYEAAAAVTADIVRALGPNGIAKGTFLNVNLPDLPKGSIRGVRITRQDTRAPIDLFEKSVTPEGTTEYKPSWKHLEPAGGDTDIWAVRNGFVSVSVFGIDQSAAAAPAAALSLKRLEKLSWR